MPLNVRRFYTSIFLVLISLVSISSAQTVPPGAQPSPQAANPQTPNAQAANQQAVAPARVPTAGEIMRDRISKAKAFIAVRNYNAAIYELENIRRETADQSVQAVVNVLLMNSYLEQGDYKKAQDFLNQAYAVQKTTKANATATYIAVASQVVKSARSRAERYRALGLNPSDRTLPLEAVNDIEKMRETLEIVITQSKEVGKDKTKTEDAMALLEEAANSRGMLARDDYDARHWKDEVADTREQITSSRSVVINAVNDGVPDMPANQNNQPVNVPSSNQVATSTQPENKPVFQPVMPAKQPDQPNTNGNMVQKTVMQSPVNQPPPAQPTAGNGPTAANSSLPNTTAPTGNTTTGNPGVKERTSDGTTAPAGNATAKEPAKVDDAKSKQEPNKTPAVNNRQPENANIAKKTDASTDSANAAKDSATMDVGPLIAYATKQTPPVYPLMAKSMRASGIVRVDVTIDENGDVAEVQKASGPPLLLSAARDAIKKWRFRPFVRDGVPVKATGFVNFNFSL